MLTILWMVNRDCSAVSGVGQKMFKRIIKKHDGKGVVAGMGVGVGASSGWGQEQATGCCKHGR